MTKRSLGQPWVNLPESPFRVPHAGRWSVAKTATKPGRGAPADRDCEKQLKALIERLDELQRMLYAQNRYAVLCIFQALDAAGKDSTIRAVLSGLNPAGFQVCSFKAPSLEELDHDFLWRTTRCLPERGRIGVFNRSYYEEVLVVRIHEAFLDRQRLPGMPDRSALWVQRFESIRDHERHLVRNGTVVLKFWLNVSKDEQRRRFLDRIRRPRKQWKFSESDVDERQHWDRYMEAYEQCLTTTSTPWAPWYAIPADRKPFMRLAVARILAETLESMRLQYPDPTSEQRLGLKRARRRLEREG